MMRNDIARPTTSPGRKRRSVIVVRERVPPRPRVSAEAASSSPIRVAETRKGDHDVLDRYQRFAQEAPSTCVQSAQAYGLDHGGELFGQGREKNRSMTARGDDDGIGGPAVGADPR